MSLQQTVSSECGKGRDRNSWTELSAGIRDQEGSKSWPHLLVTSFGLLRHLIGFHGRQSLEEAASRPSLPPAPRFGIRRVYAENPQEPRTRRDRDYGRCCRDPRGGRHMRQALSRKATPGSGARGMPGGPRPLYSAQSPVGTSHGGWGRREDLAGGTQGLGRAGSGLNSASPKPPPPRCCPCTRQTALAWERWS